MTEPTPPTNDTRPSGGTLARLLTLAAVIVAHYAIQLATRPLQVYPHLGLPDELTRHGGWVQLVDHHFWQMALALVVIGLLSRGDWAAWGLNLHNRAESLRIVRRFLWIYGVYFIGIGFVVQLLLLPEPSPGPPLTAANVVGKLAFGFLFVGVSEEILFRGLFHTWLARHWTGVWHWRGIEMPVAGVLAALVFVLAHVGIRLSTLEVTHLYPPQLLMALVLGLFYSWAYHRTGSLLAPIVAHNLSDGLLWSSEFLLAWLKG